MRPVQDHSSHFSIKQHPCPNIKFTVHLAVTSHAPSAKTILSDRRRPSQTYFYSMCMLSSDIITTYDVSSMSLTIHTWETKSEGILHDPGTDPLFTPYSCNKTHVTSSRRSSGCLLLWSPARSYPAACGKTSASWLTASMSPPAMSCRSTEGVAVLEQDESRAIYVPRGPADLVPTCHLVWHVNKHVKHTQKYLCSHRASVCQPARR